MWLGRMLTRTPSSAGDLCEVTSDCEVGPKLACLVSSHATSCLHLVWPCVRNACRSVARLAKPRPSSWFTQAQSK